VRTESPRHFVILAGCLVNPDRRERDLGSARWWPQDAVPEQYGSSAYPRSTQLLLREGCNISVSREDQHARASLHGRTNIMTTWHSSASR